MNTIPYREMIRLMDEADHKKGSTTFSMVYLACHRSKKTGGDWVTVEGVQKCGLPYHCNDHEMRGYKDADGRPKAFHLRLVFEFNGMRVIP